MALTLTSSFREDALSLFLYYKGLADKALAQVDDDAFFQAMDPESNSLAIVVQHMSGNLRSRWTNFLDSDGEKPWRNRDGEFEARPGTTRSELMAAWEEAWELVFAALNPLTEADMERTVRIRGEAHSVMQATNRSLAHAAYHCGQIVFLAKHLHGAGFASLSVPRGKSAEFNRMVQAGQASQR